MRLSFEPKTLVWILDIQQGIKEAIFLASKEDMKYTYIFKHIYIYTHTHTYTHSGILLSHKNEILPFAAAWMDLEGIK